MKQKYLVLLSLSGLILSLDQLTKGYVHSALPLGFRRSLIPNFLSFVHARNTGYALDILKSAPEPLKEVFLIGIPVFALFLIVLIFIKLQDSHIQTSVALTCIFGGAIGNLVDRIKYGYVVDFVELKFGSLFQFPPFNIADFSIIAGVLVMFYNTLLSERHKGNAKA